MRRSWLDEHAPGAELVLRMDNDMVLMTRVIRAGRGAQVLPCFLADRHADLKRLVPLDETWALDLWVLTLPDLRNNSRVRAFIHHMADELAEHGDALSGRLDAG